MRSSLAALCPVRGVACGCARRLRAQPQAAAAAARIVPNVVMEIESGEGVREAVAKGHGIGVTGEQALPCDPRLKMLRFNDAEMQINRYLACLHERRKELMVDAFFEISKTDDRALKAAP